MTVRDNEPELGPVEAVIFDVFSTLIEIYRPMRHYNALADMLRRPLTQVIAAFDPFADAFELGDIAPPERMLRAAAALELCPDTKQIDALIALETTTASKACRAYEGVAELLLALRRAGYEVGICSNANPIGVAIAQSFGLEQMVTPGAAIFSCRVGTTKPNPLIYQTDCDQLRVEPGKCLYVDDGGSRSLVGAADLGMSTVCVHHADGHAGQHPHDPDIAAIYHRASVMDVAELMDLNITTQFLPLP